MMISERIQAAIHQLEEGRFARWVNIALLVLGVLGLAMLYDIRAYHNFSSPEAMDEAQVAHNLADGKGFSTLCIRPFGIYLLTEHSQSAPGTFTNTGAADAARMNGPHPDLANAPVYPVLLAGLLKASHPDWTIPDPKAIPFKSYQPEFLIAILNQALLLVAVVITFLIAKKILDVMAAWLTAALLLGSDMLWRFSVSGLPTLLMLVIFLLLAWTLLKIEESARAEKYSARKLFLLAAVAGFLTALGMLTRYSFGWLIAPTLAFLILFGGARRSGITITAALIFAATVTPWIARNIAVSGTWFGTAGYAIIEQTAAFPDTKLMQSLSPTLNLNWLSPILQKMSVNVITILYEDLFRLGGGWGSVLFCAGLMLGLRNLPARRLRYFTLMCLGVLIFVQAAGRTHLSVVSPTYNSENLLVLVAPLICVFGIAFFLTLLAQMELPVFQIRYAVIALLAIIAWLPLIDTLMSRNSPSAYPPYYPPDIQKTSGYMKPDELIMSDIPWAVAWYGDHQCVWLTLDPHSDFLQLSGNIKPVRALYLTLDTLNKRLITGCVQDDGGWGSFVLKSAALGRVPPDFLLHHAPKISSGLFLTDEQRW